MTCVKGGLSTVSITTRMDVGGGLLCKYFELLYARERERVLSDLATEVEGFQLSGMV